MRTFERVPFMRTFERVQTCFPFGGTFESPFWRDKYTHPIGKNVLAEMTNLFDEMAKKKKTNGDQY